MQDTKCKIYVKKVFDYIQVCVFTKFSTLIKYVLNKKQKYIYKETTINYLKTMWKQHSQQQVTVLELIT